MEGNRKVLILRDFHLVEKAAPALLKTIEEPTPGTFFGHEDPSGASGG